MILCRCLALGAGLALLSLGASGLADDQVQVRRPANLVQLRPGFGQGGPLVPAEVQEKLNLTKEQKEKLEKIEKELADKTKDAEAKIKEAREKAIADKNREAFAKVREMSEEVRKVRDEFSEKVKNLLDDEQKKKFDEAQRAGRRPAIPQPNVRPFARPGEAKPDLSSKDTQEKLSLTAEQKEKLEKLQKDFDSKSLDVLTKEQKEKFEELKKQPARPRRPGTDN